MILKNFAGQDWIGFKFFRTRLDSHRKISQSAHLWSQPLSVVYKKLAQPCTKYCSLSVLWWMCDSTRMGCLWRKTPMCREQAEIRWARGGIFIVACCHSVKLCALAAQLFQSQQSVALTRMWRWCEVQPSQKERAIGAVRCKDVGMLLQLLACRCIENVVFTCPLPNTGKLPDN